MIVAPKNSNGIANRSIYNGKTIIFFLLVAFLFFPASSNNSRVVFGDKREPSKNADVFLSKISFEIEGVRLIDFLENYSENYGFSFFLDRRVDPSTPLTGSCSDMTFMQALDDLFGASQLSFFIVDNSRLLYVGPQEASGEILLLLARKNEGIGLENAPKQTVARLFVPIDFQIKPYAEPKDVFQSFAQRSHLKLSGFEKTPFDLYRGAHFDNIHTGSILTILGLGFNVDYYYDKATATFKPVSIDPNAVVSRCYLEATTKDIIKKNYPVCKFENQVIDGEKTVRVTGSFKSVAEIELLVSQKTQKNSDSLNKGSNSANKPTAKETNATRSRISGEVDNVTLRNLFTYLENNANVICKLDATLEDSGITLDSRVSCRFKNSNIHDIGSIVAKQINASPEIDGNVITFHAR